MNKDWEKLNKWEQRFVQFLYLTEFDLGKDNVGFFVVDRQGANLGNIQDDRFWHADEIFERMSIYIDDYIFRALEDCYEDCTGCTCPYKTADEWLDHKDELNDMCDECEFDLDCLDMITNHYNDIDLDNVYNYINKEGE